MTRSDTFRERIRLRRCGRPIDHALNAMSESRELPTVMTDKRNEGSCRLRSMEADYPPNDSVSVDVCIGLVTSVLTLSHLSASRTILFT